MIKAFIFPIIFAFFAVVIGLSLYLQPDDLGNCSISPSTGANCHVVDAIVAVSGGDTTARATEAIALYKNGWSNTVIFSGAAQDKTGPSNAAAMKTVALRSGVPASAIYLDEDSETTQQNAQNTETIFAEHNIKSIILVTSGYHQRRASLEFSKRATDVAILNNPVQNDKDWSFLWWTTPRGWWLASSEIIKIVIFHAMGIWA